jgi:hypothetical protein
VSHDKPDRLVPRSSYLERIRASQPPPPPEIEVTEEERKAIAALKRLARRWPRSLTLLSYDGSLSVVHTADRDYISDGDGTERQDRILADIDGIPNDGGAW